MRNSLDTPPNVPRLAIPNSPMMMMMMMMMMMRMRMMIMMLMMPVPPADIWVFIERAARLPLPGGPSEREILCDHGVGVREKLLGDVCA
eukprot:6327547-Pyramimonas_sp.AAC.1